MNKLLNFSSTVSSLPFKWMKKQIIRLKGNDNTKELISFIMLILLIPVWIVVTAFLVLLGILAGILCGALSTYDLSKDMIRSMAKLEQKFWNVMIYKGVSDRKIINRGLRWHIGTCVVCLVSIITNLVSYFHYDTQFTSIEKIYIIVPILIFVYFTSSIIAIFRRIRKEKRDM